MHYRPATIDDLPALVAIYNYYVEHSHCTFDLVPFSARSRRTWWDGFDSQRRQCWIAEEHDQILGYACSAGLKNKAAYDTSVEVSVYVDVAHCGSGIGAALYRSLLSALKYQDLHRAYALIALPNDASLALHARFGFQKVAHLHEVGRKFQRYWDVVWLERNLD
jgi:phosphinothricin acetyltransferase